jgi:hypothetical protein
MKMYQEIRCKYMDWIQLAQDREQRWALVIRTMMLRFQLRRKIS